MRVLLFLWMCVYSLDLAYSTSKPNIVFILTDDQDVFLNGTGPMSKLRKYIGTAGATFGNMYGSPAVGGLKHVPPGWTSWNALRYNSVYYNYSLSVNGVEEAHKDDYSKDYLTDVINRKAIQFITDHTTGKSKEDPFFMMLSTPSCHAPFTPAPQYSQNFSDMKAPRTPSFNTLSKDKHWLLRQVKNPMGNESMKWVDDTFRNRWRTLLSVDDMIANVVNLLDKQNVLNNTYIVYSSDNGFHLGQFSLPNDKRQFYEFDIRVPLMVRGPGVKPNQLRKELILNIDLAPTFLDLAGINPPETMDGQSFKNVLLNPPTGSAARTDFLVEHTGEYDFKQRGCPQYDGQPLNNCFPDCVCEDSQNNTYICVRRFAANQNLLYCGMTDEEQFVEAYDLSLDPDQLKNVAPTLNSTVVESLEQSLATLALCSGTACHDIKSGPLISRRPPLQSDLSYQNSAARQSAARQYKRLSAAQRYLPGHHRQTRAFVPYI